MEIFDWVNTHNWLTWHDDMRIYSQLLNALSDVLQNLQEVCLSMGWLVVDSIATIPAAKTTRVFSCRFPCLFPLLDSAEIPSFGFYPAFLRHTYHVLCWNMLNAIPQWQVLDKIPISTIPSTEISGWNVARQASCALCLSSKPFAWHF